MTRSSLFHRVLLPGFVFQSVMVGGGYGTGRELVEYFLRHGPVAGLLGMALISTVIFSVICAISFEYARAFHTYDYRAFFQHLLGRWWWIFEVGYVALLLIVLAVVGAAAGTMLEETFQVPYWIGSIAVMAAVGSLVFYGSAAVEKFMAGWSFVLYGVYVIVFGWSFARFGGEIGLAFRAPVAGSAWIIDGIKYAGYSLACVPAVLFAVRHATSRRDAVTAGVLAGPIAMIPAMLALAAMAAHYPDIVARPVPVNAMLEILGSRPLQIVYQAMLLGTLVETGAGMIHAVNERVAATYTQHHGTMASWLRTVVAIGFLLLATTTSQVGLIALVAKGYGTLTWLFLLVFALPLLTWGVWRLRAVPRAHQPPARQS